MRWDSRHRRSGLLGQPAIRRCRSFFCLAETMYRSYVLGSSRRRNTSETGAVLDEAQGFYFRLLVKYFTTVHSCSSTGHLSFQIHALRYDQLVPSRAPGPVQVMPWRLQCGVASIRSKQTLGENEGTALSAKMLLRLGLSEATG